MFCAVTERKVEKVFHNTFTIFFAECQGFLIHPHGYALHYGAHIRQ